MAVGAISQREFLVQNDCLPTFEFDGLLLDIDDEIVDKVVNSKTSI